jgi:hypothetical protein
MLKELPRHSRKIVIFLYFIILALVVAIALSLQRQTSSTERKVIESGLIESGDRPALYFNLRNIEEKYYNYTYVVTYNSTDGRIETDASTIILPPSETFAYTISLVRPSYGVMVLNLKIYRLDITNATLLHDQTWVIRAQP